MIPQVGEVALFRASLARAMAHPDFLDVFYDGFLDSSPAIAEIFAATDMKRLKRKLRSSLDMVSQLINEEPGVAEYFGYLGRVHERIGVSLPLYDFWLKSLMSAVCCCDREYDAVTARAWEAVVGYGIEKIRAAYSAAA